MDCKYLRVVDSTRVTHDSNLSVFNVPVPANFWGIFPDWWLPDNNNTLLHPFLPHRIASILPPTLSMATAQLMMPLEPNNTNWKNVKLFWPKCLVLTKCWNGCQCVICWIQIMWFVLSLCLANYGALGALGGGGVNSFPQKHNEKLYCRVWQGGSFCPPVMTGQSWTWDQQQHQL